MKRPIAALALSDAVPGQPPTPAPIVMHVCPEELLVDASYQRDLSDASIRLIRLIVEGWDWRKFKAPVVAMTSEGPVVLDGQHTATAAATHPDIDEIPVLVVEASEQRAQAEAFVGINKDRLGITAAQLHFAQVAAGNADALAIERVCATAGIRVLRLPPGRAIYKPGETIAVAMLAGLVQRRGEETATRALRILADAGFGPVSAPHIRAVEALVTDEEFAELDADDLGRVIDAIGIEVAEKEARAFMATHCVPMWKGLAAVWFKGRKTKRKPTEAESVRSASPANDEATCRSSPAGRDQQPAKSRLAAVRTTSAAQVAAARQAVPAPNFSGRKRT